MERLWTVSDVAQFLAVNRSQSTPGYSSFRFRTLLYRAVRARRACVFARMRFAAGCKRGTGPLITQLDSRGRFG